MSAPITAVAVQKMVEDPQANSRLLRHLSDEVKRVGDKLARLSGEQLRSVQPAIGENIPELRAERVASVIRARRERARHLPQELFADPAWDMMLDLLQAEITYSPVSVSSLCLASDVPATTALRWITKLVGDGLFVRRADPFDRRRVFIELASETSAALRRYFAAVSEDVT